MAWIGVALALAAIAGFALWRGRAPEPVAQPVLRFQIPPPDKHSFGALGGGGGLARSHTLALSPDGTRLVFLCRRSIRQGWVVVARARLVRGATVAGYRGRRSALLVARWPVRSRSSPKRRLYKLDLARGDRRELCAVHWNPRGGTWGATGSIIFATSNPPATSCSVPSEGGKPTPIHYRDAEHRQAPVSWPSFLPDGRRFLYWVRTRTWTRRRHSTSPKSDRKRRSREAATERYTGGLRRARVSSVWPGCAALPPAVRCRGRRGVWETRFPVVDALRTRFR